MLTGKMSCKSQSAVLLGLSLLSTSIWAAPRPKDSELLKPLWKVKFNTVFYTAPTVADLNRDGQDEIAIAGMNSMIALDGKGKTLWEWNTPERLNTYPSVWVRDEDPALIYVSDDVHTLTCLDGTGKLVWQAPLKGQVNWTSASLADLTGDGQPEVIQPDASGMVSTFDALTGRPLWATQVTGTIGCSPSVGDLTGDGTPETVVATEAGVITCLSPDGKILWTHEAGRSLYSAPVIFRTGLGEARIVAGSSDGMCLCLDASGTLLWSVPLGSPTDSSVSVGDLDQDGQMDLFVVTVGGTLYRLDERGKIVWSLDMEMRTDASGALADVDGDGTIEYVLCTHRARLLVLKKDGQILLDRDLGIDGAYNATPTFGQLDPKSPGLEAVVSGGGSGWIFCFATEAKPGPTLQWAGVRHDCRMTGATTGSTGQAEARMTPMNLSWDLLLQTEGALFKVWASPEISRPLKAQAMVLSPTTSRSEKISKIQGQEGTLALPLTVAAPGTYLFSWSLEDSQGTLLAQGQREITLTPFANERALIDSSVLQMEQVSQEVQESLPLSSQTLENERAYLSGAAQDLWPRQERALRGETDWTSVMEDTGLLVQRARRSSQIADLLSQAGSESASLIISEARIWNNREVDRSVPDRFEQDLQVQRRVVPGEHEPVAVNLLNITDRALRLRVLPGIAEEAQVDLRRAEPVPTTLGEQSWDALPRLDEASLIELPPLETRQLWLDVIVSPTAKPGPHALNVTLQILNAAGVLDGPKSAGAVPAEEVLITVDLEVLPFQMAPATSCRMCTWSYVESSGLKASPEATYEDLLAHGNNVFCAQLGQTTYDKDGLLKKSVDYEKLDEVAEHLRDRGAFLLLSGLPGLTPEPGVDGPGSPAYLAALKAYSEDLVSHMKSMGFSLDDFALYPYDEPGGRDGWKGINALVDFGKMMKSIYPDLKIYTNAYGPAGPVMFEAMAPYIDVWAPPVNLVPAELDKMAVMRATNKPIWSYNCSYNNYSKPFPDSGTLKIGDVISEYRAAGIWAFRHGLSGIGFWTYCTSPEDPWTRTATEYMMVYIGPKGPVTSRRWEGVREGIEDYRILLALKQALEGSSSSWPEPVKTKVKAFLDDSVPKFADGMTDDAALKAFREELMDVVQSIGM